MIARLCTLFATLSLMLVASCGGGGSGFIASGGIGGTGISNGTITAFGSIFVNGVEFDTSNAIFIRNGQPATESDFSVGEVVTVRGSFNTGGTTGTAQRVTYDTVVSGAVTDTSRATRGRLEVLGQTLRVTPATVFKNFNALTELSAGNVLEVSGFTNADGSVTATHITKEGVRFVPGASASEVRGYITDLDEVNMTFIFDDLIVDYSAPQMIEGVLTNGQFVEVESHHNVQDGLLIADVVRVVNPSVNAEAGQKLATEGVVTRFVSPSDFTVGSQPVTTTADTIFEHGSAADLGLNITIEVDGELNKDGVLVADGIVFRLPENTFELEGTVLAVDLALGMVTVLD
ncbi:MAG: DUF5666 domain-containing protein, partial [Pseudomonadota bacterium]|nr:DUF5666 domain-containing protein [Pseudomonadota bacterium]